MKIKIDDIIEKYGMNYATAMNLDIEGKKEISFEEAMRLRGRGILIDRKQDTYTNDLPQGERKSALSEIFKSLNK